MKQKLFQERRARALSELRSKSVDQQEMNEAKRNDYKIHCTIWQDNQNRLGIQKLQVRHRRIPGIKVKYTLKYTTISVKLSAVYRDCWIVYLANGTNGF